MVVVYSWTHVSSTNNTTYYYLIGLVRGDMVIQLVDLSVIHELDDEISSTGLTVPHCCAYPKTYPECQTSYVLILFVFNVLMWGGCSFIDIGVYWYWCLLILVFIDIGVY